MFKQNVIIFTYNSHSLDLHTSKCQGYRRKQNHLSSELCLSPSPTYLTFRYVFTGNSENCLCSTNTYCPACPKTPSNLHLQQMRWHQMSSSIKFSAYFGKGGIPVMVPLHKPWKRSAVWWEAGKPYWHPQAPSSTTLKAQDTSQKQNCFVDDVAEGILFPVLKIHQLFSGVIPPRCAFPS